MLSNIYLVFTVQSCAVAILNLLMRIIRTKIPTFQYHRKKYVLYTRDQIRLPQEESWSPGFSSFRVNSFGKNADVGENTDGSIQGVQELGPKYWLRFRFWIINEKTVLLERAWNVNWIASVSYWLRSNSGHGQARRYHIKQSVSSFLRYKKLKIWISISETGVSKKARMHICLILRTTNHL